MARGGKVTAHEKEEMWALYQTCGSYKKVALAMNRSPDTVSKYVREIEIARQAASNIPIIVIKYISREISIYLGLLYNTSRFRT